jgi:hypothetical protein
VLFDNHAGYGLNRMEKQLAGLLGCGTARDKVDRGGKLVAFAGDSGDDAITLAAATKRLAEEEDMLREIALFDKRIGPDGREQFLLRDHLVGMRG